MRMKLKTKEQLLADGWVDDVYLLWHPATAIRIVASMYRFLGIEIPAEPNPDYLGDFRYADYVWPAIAFVSEGESDSPVEKPTAKRKNKPNPFIKQFANADLLTARGMIRCGFELETQKTEGYTKDDGELDEDAFYDALREEADELENDLREVLDHHIACAFLERLDSDDFESVMNALGIDTVRALCDYTGYSYDSVRNEIEDRARGNIEESDYQTGGISEISVPANMVVGYDQSVEGFEFATKGARTYAEFIRAASDIFQLDHEIDTGCSFHIHLSVVGIDHVPGALLTKRMTEYILDRQDQLPESVRERFAASKKFYRPRLDPHEKFAFVRRHPEYRTWEFRCFGNVTNARDAKICLDMALAALQYAYKCKQSNVRLPGDQVYDSDWVELACKAMEENKSLTDLLVGESEAAA